MTEERRYSDDEVAEILDRATAASDSGTGRSLTAGGQGLSLGELEAIGAEVGIPADRIREAATSLEFPAGAPAAHRRFMGTTIGVGRTFQLPRELTEAEWNALVVDLRDTFEAKGAIQQDGAFRQWTNGNLQVLLEPMGDGARLRLKTLKGSAYSGLVGGGALMAMGTLATLFSTGAPDTAVFMTMAAAGVVLHLTSRLGLPGWAKTRQRQMEDIGARVIGRMSAAGPARLTDGE